MKLYALLFYGRRFRVTPFVGVWIETDDKLYIGMVNMVTPFVGVWIETNDEH